MVNRRLFSVLLLSAAVLFGGFTDKPLVDFTPLDWDSAKAKAKQQGKVFMVDFEAGYCSACRKMDKVTYQDSELAAYAKNNAVMLRANVQSFDYVQLSIDYKVEALPTMLFFNEKGELVKRVEGYMDGKQMLAALKEACINGTKTNTNPGLATTPKPATPASSNESPSKPSATDEPILPAAKPTTPKGLGLFEFEVKRLAPKGYALQVGVYGDYVNVLREVEKLNARIDMKGLVNVNKVGDRMIYKLLVGIFDSETAAENYRATLRKAGYDGLVKNLAELR